MVEFTMLPTICLAQKICLCASQWSITNLLKAVAQVSHCKFYWGFWTKHPEVTRQSTSDTHVPGSVWLGSYSFAYTEIHPFQNPGFLILIDRCFKPRQLHASIVKANHTCALAHCFAKYGTLSNPTWCHHTRLSAICAQDKMNMDGNDIKKTICVSD